MTEEFLFLFEIRDARPFDGSYYELDVYTGRITLPLRALARGRLRMLISDLSSGSYLSTLRCASLHPVLPDRSGSIERALMAVDGLFVMRGRYGGRLVEEFYRELWSAAESARGHSVGALIRITYESNREVFFGVRLLHELVEIRCRDEDYADAEIDLSVLASVLNDVMVSEPVETKIRCTAKGEKFEKAVNSLRANLATSSDAVSLEGVTVRT